MTDLRSLTILGVMARLVAQVDKGVIVPPQDVKAAIANGTILKLLQDKFGDYPEFSPIHKAEAVLFQQEFRTVLDSFGGREKFKLGLENNGLCFLLAYCMEMLLHRNIKEITG